MAKVQDMHLRDPGSHHNVNETRNDPSRLLDTVQRFVRLAQAARDRRTPPESAVDIRWEAPADNPRDVAEELK